MHSNLRIIFAGTPDFAAAHLQTLLDSHHEVIAVYSQPDRPAGRGKKLAASPVKTLALAHDIPVFQPVNFKTPEAIAQLEQLNADLMVVVAYGLILPKAVLDAPRLGCINVHASLLPRWRGAAPIQRAIEAGDEHTGVTIMQMDVGLDTGDMLTKAHCPIFAEDTGGSLHDKLITLGGPALLATLDQLAAGTATPERQDDSLSNYAPKLSKEEAALDWSLPAETLARKVRAFNPFPVAHTKPAGSDDSHRLRVWAAQALSETSTAEPGTLVRIDDKGIAVACHQGVLLLQSLQLPGKKAMSVSEVVRGHPNLFKVGDRLEQPSC